MGGLELKKKKKKKETIRYTLTYTITLHSLFKAGLLITNRVIWAKSVDLWGLCLKTQLCISLRCSNSVYHKRGSVRDNCVNGWPIYWYTGFHDLSNTFLLYVWILSVTVLSITIMVLQTLSHFPYLSVLSKSG